MTGADILAADAHRFPLSGEDEQRVADEGFTLGLVEGHEPAQFAAAGPNAVALLAWGGPYDARVFDALPKLRILARGGVGYDNIDLAAAASRGNVTTYAPDMSSDEVAEHAIALMLAITRKLADSERAVRAGKWLSAAQLAPMQVLRGSRLGLVGFGKIARAVAWRALGLGLSVAAYDPFVTDNVFDGVGVTRAESLEDLLAESDFVSLHTPGRPGDPPLIGVRELTQVKRGAVLINTARGSLLDPDALVAALHSGQLGGAGLDVMNPEPVPPDHPLLGFANVTVTPHSAAFSISALADLRRSALDNIFAVLRGDPPLTPIPVPQGTPGGTNVNG
jgi:phosphoglycerate dehydrogenase-like enzyme